MKLLSKSVGLIRSSIILNSSLVVQVNLISASASETSHLPDPSRDKATVK